MELAAAADKAHMEMGIAAEEAHMEGRAARTETAAAEEARIETVVAEAVELSVDMSVGLVVVAAS
jgi:hypothetical protein